MHPITYSTLCLAPLIAILMFFYLNKHRDRAFLNLLIRSMFAGMLGVVLLLIALGISSALGINELRNLKRTLFFSFITLGGSAELGKFLVYRYIIMLNRISIHPFDSILLSIGTALGYSTLALLLFLLNYSNIQQSFPETLFAITFIPANLLFAVVIGFFTGMARFLKNHFVYSITGLFVAALFNGIFTFCLVTRDFKLLSIFAFGSTVIVFILAMKAAFIPDKPENANINFPEQSE